VLNRKQKLTAAEIAALLDASSESALINEFNNRPVNYSKMI